MDKAIDPLTADIISDISWRQEVIKINEIKLKLAIISVKLQLKNVVLLTEMFFLRRHQCSEVDGVVKRIIPVGQVAFSASLLESGSGYTGPINAHTTLVFRYVVSNIGSAYSPHTGLFTAPVRGAYHFEFYILDHGGAHASGVILVKNGEHIFMAGEHQTNGHSTAANGATLLLQAGDVVFLRLCENHRIYDNGNHHSTFSGHLLFPM
uniref:C1q domain-containing protein n=1 Tax=Neogobius melanostomus TaxID=47308 RepID=A0A8C6TAP1_9GOBI